MKVGALATTIFALLIGFPIASMAGLAPDADNDGVPDSIDTCLVQPNAGDCDTDQDGYGNSCDGDFSGNNATDASDFLNSFLPDFLTATDSGTGTDMSCNGTVDASDFLNLFLPQFLQGTPGPSGLSCAGVPVCP